MRRSMTTCKPTQLQHTELGMYKGQPCLLKKIWRISSRLTAAKQKVCTLNQKRTRRMPKG